METQSAKAGTSPAVHSPIMSSPKVKRKKMEDKSPKGKSSFPTSQSFLAEDIPHHPSTSRTTYKPVETKDEGINKKKSLLSQLVENNSKSMEVKELKGYCLPQS